MFGTLCPELLTLKTVSGNYAPSILNANRTLYIHHQILPWKSTCFYSQQEQNESRIDVVDSETSAESAYSSLLDSFAADKSSAPKTSLAKRFRFHESLASFMLRVQKHLRHFLGVRAALIRNNFFTAFRRSL